MRSAALFLELLVLLPIVLVRPFVGVLLWSWFSFMNPHRLVYGGIALYPPWAQIIFVVTIAGCILNREPKRLPINAVTVLITLFLLLISFTTMFALGPWVPVEEKFEAVGKVFLFLLVTAALLEGKQRIHGLIWIMAMSLGFFGIKGGVFTLLSGGANRVYGPELTMIYDNNHIAVALLVSIPLMNYLRLESRHAVVRLGLVGMMALSLLATVGSYSRGALLALAAVAGYFWLKSSQKFLSASVGIAMLVAAFAFMPAGWYSRMETIQEYNQDDSAVSRLEVWQTAWKMAVARPFTGAGFFATYTKPVVEMFNPGAGERAVHSIWFEVLAEHGFPTFFVWCGILVAGAVYAYRTIKLAEGIPGLEWCVNLAKMAQVSMIAYVVGGSFLSLSYWDYFFTILIAVTAVHQHVVQTLGQPAKGRRPAIDALPARLALTR